MKSKKLIIHETDYHGCGYVTYNGETRYYSYDDGMGDMRAAVQELIDMGFIKTEDVIILENDEVYDIVEQYYNGEG
jgi:hypothetical protein